MEFDNFVAYCEHSPSKLVWKVMIRNNFGKIKTYENKPVGCINKSTGYFVFKLQGKQYYCHRVILQIDGVDLTNKEVDHLNGDRSDNSRINLREVKRGDNAKNRKRSVKNQSGVVGVHWDSKAKAYTATWSIGGKPNSKDFSINKFGANAFEKAVEFRKNMIKQIGGYTERHGEFADDCDPK